MKYSISTLALAMGLLGIWSATALAQDDGEAVDAAAVNGVTVDEHAMRGVLRGSGLYNFGGGADLQHGFGLDLRYELYPDGAEDGYIGVFSQNEYQTGDAWRFAGGVNAGWGVFGLELGVSHRTATDMFAGSTGLHIGQSFTFGPMSIGARLTVPLHDHIPTNIVAPMATQGIEGAVVLRLGWGFQVHGPRRAHGCHAHVGQRRNPHQRRGCHHRH